jgi:hypothetical protein
MKARPVYWFSLLGAGLICLFQPVLQPPPPARITMENDVVEIPSTANTPSSAGFDPYFIPENRCDYLFIQPHNSKKNGNNEN